MIRLQFLRAGVDFIAVTPIPKLDSPRNGHGPFAAPLARIPRVDETECVGGNLCSLVCPVEGCITKEEARDGAGSADMG